MNEKSEKYHIKVPVDFLFGTIKLFKSKYTKWVYIYLKLKFNFYLFNKPNTPYKINVNEIAEFFGINRATAFDCIKELWRHMLLKKSGKGLYILCRENEMWNFEIDTKVFMPIYYNLFFDFWGKGVTPEIADVFFYLVNANRHHIKDDYLIKSSVSQAKICRDLKIGHRTYKKCKEALIYINYLYGFSKTPFTIKQGPDVDNDALEQAKVNIQKTIHNSAEEINSDEKWMELLKSYKILVWKLCKDKNGVEYAIPFAEHKDYGVGWETTIAVKRDNFAKYEVSFYEN